jgi:hypothetical protein
VRTVDARYPDGSHDAEAIAIHPDSGDLWLATKSPLGSTEPVRIYRLTAAQLTASGEQTFAHAGDIPVSAFGRGIGLPHLVTAMDISPDGERFVLLTYGGAAEFAFGAGAQLPGFDRLVEGRTHRPLATAIMIQAESIAYGADGRTLIYTTESIRGSAAPIARQECSEAAPE